MFQGHAAGDDKASVCSCTCYGRSSGNNSNQQQQQQQQEGSPPRRAGATSGHGGRLLWCVGKMFGCRESVTHLDEENFYDAETQSISNYARFAIKRASF